MIIPIPVHHVEEPILPPITTDEGRNEWIRWFLDCEHWKCASCNITNFGRNKYCANTKCKQGRPTSYVESIWLPKEVGLDLQ